MASKRKTRAVTRRKRPSVAAGAQRSTILPADYLTSKGWIESNGWWLAPEGVKPYKAKCYRLREAFTLETSLDTSGLEE